MPRGWREVQKPETADSQKRRRKLTSWRNGEWRIESNLPRFSCDSNTEETKVIETMVDANLSDKTESVFSGSSSSEDPAPYSLYVPAGDEKAQAKPTVMPSVDGASKNTKPLSLFPFIGRGMPNTIGVIGAIPSPTSAPQWRQLLSIQDAERMMQDLSLDTSSDMQKLKRLEHEQFQWEKERRDLLAQQEYLGGELEKVQHAKEEITQQMTSLQTDLRAKEDRVRELETTLSTAQQALEEYRQKEACDWVIRRDEVHVTNKCLGVGGWGTVFLGSFRGCKVAVKQIHELILSPHNRRLFEREMNIASRCRHPCLLQFIGATNDGESPLFVTELMETSLRALLEQRRLAETEVSVISLDVALALNYLHKKNPPIIHRDISSANVLLWKQGDQWRGKVSDYGTANFMQQTMTVAPGAMIYSAPEALTSNQTDKVDVYSFGVLLCEMCIRELPDPKQRGEQVALVTSHVFRTVIRRCLPSDPFTRPNMDEIIDYFNSEKHLFQSPC